MVDRIATQSVVLEGGVMENLPTIDQGMRFPGSLQTGQNFEPDYDGGYARVQGFSKYDIYAVGENEGTPPTGSVLGVWILGNTVCAVRGRDLFSSEGSDWTKRSTSQLNANPGQYNGTVYQFGTTDTLIIVNSQDYPVTWDGTTYTSLSGTGLTGSTAPSFVINHKYHMFYCRGQLVTFSAPGDPNDVSVPNGGGQINVGHEVTAMIAYRDALYCLGPKSISKITGSSSNDFALQSVAETVGIVDPRTLHEVNGDIVFLSYDGVRSIASTEKIGDVNLENLSRNIEQKIRNTTPNASAKDVCATVINSKNQYRLFVSDSTAVRGSQPGFLGALRKQSQGGVAWEWFTTKGIEATCANHGIISNAEVIVHGDYNGYVYKQEDGNSFDGDTISATLQFPYWSFNDPEIRKTLHKLRSYITAGSSVTPTYQMTLDYLDQDRAQPQVMDGSTAAGTFSQYGTAIYGSAVYSSGVTYVTDFNLVGTCFNAALTISSSDTNAPYTVQTLNIQYGVGGRK